MSDSIPETSFTPALESNPLGSGKILLTQIRLKWRSFDTNRQGSVTASHTLPREHVGA